jgi:hypothetical protein
LRRTNNICSNLSYRHAALACPIDLARNSHDRLLPLKPTVK